MTAPVGRPTDYTQELADRICEELSCGASLRTVCQADDLPEIRSVFRWLRKYPEFSQQYAKAKEESKTALAEELLDIVDDGSNDWMETHDPDNPGYRINGESIQRSRLRADTRKWFLSKLDPKKYGDKVQTEHSGSLQVSELSESQVMERLTQLFAKAKSANESPGTE